MSNSTQTLNVILADKVIGVLEQLPTGSRRFTYIDDWENTTTPLSLSMPPRKASYGQRIIDPFLWGLLPDNHLTRQSIGRQFGVSSSNPMALLSKIGLDCAGAVRFCEPDATESVLDNRGKLVPLSKQEIAERLRELAQLNRGILPTEEESWSLAGNQAKMALRFEDGKWFCATGAQATTHIFKPGIQELESQALNECVCMNAALKLGLSASKVSYVEFDGEPAICVERYDRMRTEDGRLIRIHQEDLCQALSIDPDNKYPSDGGPNAESILDLLSNAGRAELRNRNRENFVDALFFNYLILAPDGHAKNYSLLLLADAVFLAPLYDIASGAPYTKDFGQPRYTSAAMRIGGEDRFGNLTGSHLKRFTQRNHLDESWVFDRFRQLATKIPEALEEVFSELSPSIDSRVFREALLEPVSLHCFKTLQKL